MTAGKQNGHRDALVIVAKYPTPERVKTRLGATIGYEQSARLYRAFLYDLAERFGQAAPADGYALIWACVEDAATMRPILGTEAGIITQRGDDFSERLYHICRDVAALGYARTIILGSDSPQVPAARVAHALSLLERADVVLGPADDGGYYLVGLRNHPVPPDIFTGIEMSTSLVFAQTVARANLLGLSVEQVAMTLDVDTEQDMLRLALVLNASPHLAPHTHSLLEEMLAPIENAKRAIHGAR